MLDIGHSNIGDGGVIMLVEEFKRRRLNQLKKVLVRDNNIGPEGAKKLAYSFPDMNHLGKMAQLDVRENDIMEEGGTALQMVAKSFEVRFELLPKSIKTEERAWEHWQGNS